MNAACSVCLLIIFSITNCFASNETFYIVASYNSSCPSEFGGESCLTLMQYVSNPSRSSNITLILESGNHALQDHALFFDSDSGNNIFIMFTEYFCAPTITNATHYFHMSGITFTGYKGEINVQSAHARGCDQ